MPPRIRRPLGPQGRRRGVTLLEMLVVVALVVLMMTILVQIFQSATGAMSISRTTTEMDVTLRQIESILRSDLSGVTAKMTPPNDPKDQRGYFEYGENAPADAQGEDTDDYLAFTTKAPDGVFFTGRQVIARPGSTPAVAPITSQVAEVIYFLRNGNLYRRVFLVAPDRKSSIALGSTTNFGFITNLFGAPIAASWLGLNDISCHPGPANTVKPIPNTLGDLTNRENRAFRPRFGNDFFETFQTGNADGIADDFNGDGLPDYYPTMYASGADVTLKDVQGNTGTVPNGQVHSLNTFPQPAGRLPGSNYSVYGFPFIYPGMYTFPSSYSGVIRYGTNLGWSHCLAPAQDATSSNYILNHAPLLTGDNLLLPAANQTWWGFPTWRETMTGSVAASGTGSGKVGWVDPMYMIGATGYRNSQEPGLVPYSPSVAIATMNTDTGLLPPIATFDVPQPGTDLAAGSATFVATPSPDNPQRVYEDDLLLTNVRSFDVKAYDLNAPLYNDTTVPLYFSAGYQDLGYGSTYYEQTGKTTDPSGSTYNYLFGPYGNVTTPPTNPATPWQSYGSEPVGFGHEGRIPPRLSDFRPHPRRGYNIGDDTAGVIRLTRVWDSWSTDYTNAPDYDIFLNNYSSSLPAIYPSFPPPYPTPLRGIQIQIRMTDARGERTKAITIRHDFTDKLN